MNYNITKNIMKNKNQITCTSEFPGLFRKWITITKNIMKNTNPLTHVNFLEFFVNELQYYKEFIEKYDSNNTSEFPGIFRKWITITKNITVFEHKWRDRL